MATYAAPHISSTVAELEIQTCKVAELQQSLGQHERQGAVRVRELQREVDELRDTADRLHTTNSTLQQRADQAEVENAVLKIQLAYFTAQQNAGHNLAAGICACIGVLDNDDDAAAAADDRPDPAARQMR